MVLALTQNHKMTKKEQNEKIAQEMRQHVTCFQNGNLSCREYCAAYRLAEHKLYYWLNKIKKEQADMANGATTGFLRVRPDELSSALQSPGASILPSMEVNLSNGTRLVFYQAISKDLLTIFL
jgi:hypothetical protein